MQIVALEGVALGIKSSLLVVILGCLCSTSAFGQFPVPAPTPDPASLNIFYGALNPAVNFETPVLIFVPGLGGTAFNWFTDNDMYSNMYLFGYRTAFISPNVDNSPATSDFDTNAEQLKLAIPRVAAHYNATEVYLIGHSKGGLDIQAAMTDANIRSLAKAVFTISTPNQGTELADWAFANPGLAGPLNLLTPAVDSMKLANVAALRQTIDPLIGPQKNFYTLAGNQFVSNILTFATGAILRSLAPGIRHDTHNDGLVTVARSRLAPEISNDIGIIPTNHLDTDSGSASFPKITARIQALENSYNDEFKRLAVNGLAPLGGDDSNTWIWSSAWFKGKYYIGTAREAFCVSLLTSDVRTTTEIYPFSFLTNQCPGELELAGSLAAEIWQYTPETQTWLKVHASPNTIPVQVNGTTVLTARDVGFRGMTVHVEPDGTEALYAGGVTSGSVYDPDNTAPGTFHGPSLMRSVDGDNWAPVPQTPGTFLGDIGDFLLDPQTKVRSFRSLTSYKGELFATVGSYVGSGVIIASSNPAAGDDAWRVAGPPYEQMAAWTLKVYNDFLYVTSGFTRQQNPDADGYALLKTDASGDAPYTFAPVITQGGFQTDPDFVAPNGLSFGEYRGELYLGTNRPTELVRVRPDDSWDLMVGEPRDTPTGFKRPLTGFGNGFGSWFNGHFWRMAEHENKLFLGTWDWSVGLQSFSLLDPLDKLFGHSYGFDFFRTDDAIHWTAITQTGLGDPNNSGVRSLESTPQGLFVGTARQRYGAEVFQRVGVPETPLAPPWRLQAESEETAGRTVNLSWQPTAGADKYNIYRSTARPIEELVEIIFPMQVTDAEGGVTEISRQDVQDGELSWLCPSSTDPGISEAPACEFLQLAAEQDEEPANLIPASFPLAYVLVGQTDSTSYSEPAPTRLQSIYFVRAVDAEGKLSPPSNLAGGPSKAASREPVACDIDTDGDVDGNDIAQLTEASGKPALSPTDPRDVNQDGVISVLDISACTDPDPDPEPEPVPTAARLRASPSSLSFELTQDAAPASKRFTVRAIDGEIAYTIQPGASWLSSNLRRGSSNGEVDSFLATVDPAGLAPGAYSRPLFVRGGGQTRRVFVTLLVTPGEVPLDPPGPVVNDGGVVNAASMTPSGLPGHPVSPQSAVAIFGRSFTEGVHNAETIPLPLELGGVSVAFDGIPAGLFYASPGQLLAQLPGALLEVPGVALSGTTTMVVTNELGSSEPRTVQLNTFSPAIYTLTQTGSGQGVVVFSNTVDVAAPLGAVGASRPAKEGDYLTIYANGLGLVNPVIEDRLNSCDPDGQCAPDLSNLVRRETLTRPIVKIGGVAVPDEDVRYSGLSALFVALNEIVIRFPTGVPTGDAIPILIEMEGISSREDVTIAVE